MKLIVLISWSFLAVSKAASGGKVIDRHPLGGTPRTLAFLFISYSSRTALVAAARRSKVLKACLMYVPGGMMKSEIAPKMIPKLL